MEISKKGNAIYFNVGVWFNEDDNSIHMTAPDFHGFHTTINDRDGSKRCHQNLHMKLARALKEAGAPHPEYHDNRDDD